MLRVFEAYWIGAYSYKQFEGCTCLPTLMPAICNLFNDCHEFLHVLLQKNLRDAQLPKFCGAISF